MKTSENTPKLIDVGTIFYATSIVMLMLLLYYYWFAVADRYEIFLYGHLGATPFDEVTSSRYWMAGLVAAAMVMVIMFVGHGGARWVAKWRGQGYTLADWRRVWLVCAVPVGAGILLITMLTNAPTLPLSLAVASVVAAWVGLALALVAVQKFVRNTREFMWLAWISVGVVPALVLIRALELPARGVIAMPYAVAVSVGTSIFGLVWATLWLWLYQRWQKRVFTTWQMAVAVCVWSYLFLPLLHYWVFAPAAYRYISTSTNFFARSIWVQLLSFAIVWGILRMAEAVSQWRVPAKQSNAKVI